MNIKEINNFLKNNKIPSFRLKQIIKAIYHDNIYSFKEITVLPKILREKIEKEINILSFSKNTVLISKKKDSYKASLELKDGFRIESVLLQQSKTWSVCISSQAGCALGCRFCATGANGFHRNLSQEEINDQVLFWRMYIQKQNLNINIKNIVFMGMGEAFMNYSEFKKSMKNFLDPTLFNFSSRHISVSTAGLPKGIKKISHDFPQINLAISLICADNKKRTNLMPINNTFNLNEIKEALNYYFNHTHRKVFLEYIMFKNINDQKEDANNLIDFIKSNSRPDLLHVNLIAYNMTNGEFKSSNKKTINWFRNYLLKHRINTTIRKSLGDEIKAACGQLAGQIDKK